MSIPTLRRFSGLALLLLVAALMAVPAYAQGGRGGGRDRWEQMSDEEREAMMEQMRERMAQWQAEQDEQMREDIDASEEEFEVLLPKIERLRQLTREQQMASASAMGGFGRGGFGRGGRGGRGGDAGRGGRGGGEGEDGGRGRGDRRRGNPMAEMFETSEEGEALMEAQTELREALEEKAVTADIKEALEAYREARDAMAEALEEAREDLRGLLTARQEAYFVVNGLLD